MQAATSTIYCFPVFRDVRSLHHLVPLPWPPPCCDGQKSSETTRQEKAFFANIFSVSTLSKAILKVTNNCLILFFLKHIAFTHLLYSVCLLPAYCLNSLHPYAILVNVLLLGGNIVTKETGKIRHLSGTWVQFQRVNPLPSWGRARQKTGRCGAESSHLICKFQGQRKKETSLV